VRQYGEISRGIRNFGTSALMSESNEVKSAMLKEHLFGPFFDDNEYA
jgi:hypothetical protein